MSVDRFFIFLVCVAVGAAGGVFYEFFYLLRTFFRMRWVQIAGDILFCILFGALYLFVSVMMGLEHVRLYSLAGCLCGLFLYLKSFHKIVAFFAEKVYNGIREVRKEHVGWKKGKGTRKRK